MGYQYYKAIQMGYTSATITALDTSLLYNPTIILSGLILVGLLALIFSALVVSMRNSMRLASRIMTEAAK